MAAQTVERRSDPALSTNLAQAVAEQLRAAIDRVGTDEEAVYAALTGRTDAERTMIREQYLALTGRELLADIGSEFSGTELVRATMLFHQYLSSILTSLPQQRPTDLARDVRNVLPAATTSSPAIPTPSRATP
jgi:hypothetical protein